VSTGDVQLPKYVRHRLALELHAHEAVVGESDDELGAVDDGGAVGASEQRQGCDLGNLLDDEGAFVRESGAAEDILELVQRGDPFSRFL
jgi:hypothetical protein